MAAAYSDFQVWGGVRIGEHCTDCASCTGPGGSSALDAVCLVPAWQELVLCLRRSRGARRAAALGSAGRLKTPRAAPPRAQPASPAFA